MHVIPTLVRARIFTLLGIFYPSKASLDDMPNAPKRDNIQQYLASEHSRA